MRLLAAGCLLAAVAVGQLENLRVGVIDFYALNGLNEDKVRAALTVRVGDKLEWPATRDRIAADLSREVGRAFTHFAPICCDSGGRLMLYIGFGDTTKSEGYRPKPARDLQLPIELTVLYEEYLKTLPDSLKHAAGTPDDYSLGYSVSRYLPMRAIQERTRELALEHENLLLRVLLEAADDRQRGAASHMAGYTRHSERQVAALMEASRDANATVRNNATRALGVLASTPAFARWIPAEPFIDKLNSPVWSDRNKGLMLLTSLTRGRDPKLLETIRSRALPSLIEMARWQFAGHASGPILLLGRMAGIEESELAGLAQRGDEAPVLAVLEKR